MSGIGKQAVVFAITASLAILSTGCERWQGAVAAGIGWIAGAASVPTRTETTCFQNGVPIDCADLPSSVTG